MAAGVHAAAHADVARHAHRAFEGRDLGMVASITSGCWVHIAGMVGIVCNLATCTLEAMLPMRTT